VKKSKFSLLLVLALVLSMFLSACSGSKKDDTDKTKNATKEKAPEQVLNVLESAEIPTMDSVMAQDVVSFTMLNAVNEGLYRLDPDQKVIDGVADGKPVANADGTVYTIKLKQDTKWSNGDPVTAHDFVYAWQRSIDPATASPYGPYFMSGKIKNASEIAAGKMKASELGIKATDDYTLEITLVQPLPYFDSFITFPLFQPQDQKYVESQGKDYGKDASHLIYNGPFTMTKWDGPQGTEWVLAKNDTYWDAKDVSLKTVNFNVSKDPQASANAFEAGEVDITPKLAQPAIISQYENSPNLERYLEPSVFWLKFNEKNPILKNVNIRKALSLAVDKEAFTKDVLANGSVPANYIVAADFTSLNGKDFRADTGKYLESNKDEAKKYWEKGLAELGKKEITLDYVGQDTETSKVSDAFIKDQLEKTLTGLKVNLTAVPFSVKLEREDKQQYDILFSGWGPDYADPMTYMDLWLSDGTQQHMSYANPKVDKLIKDAAGPLATKPEERWKAMQEAEKIVLEDDAALAPMYQRAVNKLISSKVKGFAHHAFGPDYSVQWVKIVNVKK
jgi:oligopeptide transport system substrate-binding protein